MWPLRFLSTSKLLLYQKNATSTLLLCFWEALTEMEDDAESAPQNCGNCEGLCVKTGIRKMTQIKTTSMPLATKGRGV